MRHIQYIFVASLVLMGCVEGGAPVGLLVPTDTAPGPTVVFDPLKLPVPDVPFPNDMLLLPTDQTATGYRWNVSQEQPTHHQEMLRQAINFVDGFNPVGPVFLSFSNPLDLTTVSAETVMLINIEPGHPREGESIPLDLGRGHYPTMTPPTRFYGNDVLGEHPDLIFPVGNALDLDGDGEPEPMGHYDVESNSLIIRPIRPLAAGARHAVLLTTGIKGRAGSDADGPIRSAFATKAHVAQIPLVQRALESVGLPENELAFGWTFTTTDVMEPMLRFRDGLYGEGPMAWLEALAPPRLLTVNDTSILHDGDLADNSRDHSYILQASFFSELMRIFALVQEDDNFNVTFEHVDYIVFGSIQTPNLRSYGDHRISVNPHTGDGLATPQAVPIMISVPKTTEQHKPPFPVMIYMHGTGTSRIEPLPIADAMARQGIAVVSLDQVGHGPVLRDIPRLLAENPDIEDIFPAIRDLLANLLVPGRVNEFYDLSVEASLDMFKEIGLFAELAVNGRGEDINGDGVMDIGEGFFFSDPTRLCASFQQDTVDVMQLVRVLRALRQDAVPSTPLADPANATAEALMPYLLSGDFNADGVLDIGGPGVQFSAAGTSLGGFHSVLAGATEKEITTISPIVAGGGLGDVLVRSGLHMIMRPLFAEVFGTLVVGCATDDGWLYLTLGDDAERCRRPRKAAFARLEQVEPGTAVRVKNVSNGLEGEAIVNEKGGFFVTVASDHGDRLEIELGPETAPLKYEVVTPFDGSGYARNTSELRQVVNIQQHVFAACDPSNFAPYLFMETPRDHPPTNLLLLTAIGDDTVPVSTAVNLAVAAGAMGKTDSVWQPRADALIDIGTLNNSFHDVDDIRNDNPTNEPALGPFPPIDTGNGLATIRFAPVEGKHEYIAGRVVDGFDYGVHDQNRMSIFHGCSGKIVMDTDAECIADDTCGILDDISILPGCIYAAGQP